MKNVNTILIVDDDPGARETLEALLQVEGYQLILVSNGEEAIAQAKQVMPSLILLDVMMPDMDGFEVCRRLRSIPLLAEVPVILVTALDDRDSRLEGIEAGADDFISKPYDRTELRARVRTITRLDRYRRLLQERTKFEWVVQHADAGYLIIDEYDQILYANAHARTYLGLPAVYAEPREERIETAEVSDVFLDLARKQYQLEPQEAWANWPTPLDDSAASPRYLVRPESSTADAFWLRVDSLDLPSWNHGKGSRVLRLLDVTSEIVSQRNKREFHTMICHKLRTPLAGILGSLDFLKEHSAKLSSTEVTDFSNMALQSARRLHSEIEDILQYLNASTVSKTGENFHFSQLRPLVNQIRTDLQLKPVSFVIHEELQNAWTLFSRQALGLVMWEILENAKKFHPHHDPAVEIEATPAGADFVQIAIRDNGTSLAPDQLSQIWMSYYQGEKYTTGETKGMGLGLAMVASLIWEAGGTCEAYNREDGPGIVVNLVIPLLKA